jgi:hypothetical protein
MEVPMSSSMAEMLKSGVEGVREGADAVSHTMGDVLTEVRARVDDLVDVAHPRRARARGTRGGVLMLVVVAVAGFFLVRKLTARSPEHP